MTDRTAARVATALWLITIAVDGAIGAFVVLDRSILRGADLFFNVMVLITSLSYATVGWLIASRRAHPLGWIFAIVGLGLGLAALGEGYALRALVVAPGSLPGSQWLIHFSFVGYSAAAGSVGLLFLLFPDGRPPGRGWRVALWGLVGGTAVATLAFALRPGNLNGAFNDYGVRLTNPLALEGLGPALNLLLTTGVIVAFLSGIGSVVALILRFRRSTGEQRQQIKWFAYVAATTLASFVVALIFSEGPAGDAAWALLFLSMAIGIPVASALAILKYRLYDLDIVVKKTVVFAVLALFITAAYLLAVGLVGAFVADQSTSTVAFAAGAIAALAFQPVRALARRLADRLVYGKRASPYEVLSEFSDRMAGTYSTDDVLPRMAQILAAGTGAEHAQVWLLVGSELREAASWPGEAPAAAAPIRVIGDQLPAFLPERNAFEVRHQGELLGAVTVAMPVSDPMDPARAKLVQDMAAQAGLVLRNVRLIEELRASRQRLVAAQDQERRRIERNIHDGAQQQLVALSVKLRLLEQLASRDSDKASQLASELQSEANDALENLRDLARGIYPPLLADRGLAEALGAQARKAPIPVTVESDGTGRYPQEVEAAAYFCALEALQNVAKYAAASHATVRLAGADDHLTFTVKDDGVGFDPNATGFGSGLTNIRDRLEALGGTLEISSAPGEGTTITGRIPARATEAGG